MKTNINFVTISRSFLLKMKNVSHKSCREYQNTHFVFRNFFPEKSDVYKIRRKNTIGRGRSQVTIWRMRIVCWIPKATNTHSGCVMLIAFPMQQWLHEQASMLRYTYIVCLVFYFIFIYLFN
jgi:hypothetical protein